MDEDVETQPVAGQIEDEEDAGDDDQHLGDAYLRVSRRWCGHGVTERRGGRDAADAGSGAGLAG